VSNRIPHNFPVLFPKAWNYFCRDLLQFKIFYTYPSLSKHSIYVDVLWTWNLAETQIPIDHCEKLNAEIGNCDLKLVRSEIFMSCRLSIFCFCSRWLRVAKTMTCFVNRRAWADSLCGLVVRVPDYRTEEFCFLRGTNWIYICYKEESRPPLRSSGQSSWLQNGDILCFLRGTNWIYICYVEKVDHLCGVVVRVPGYRTEKYCFLWDTNRIYVCYVEESGPPLCSSGQSSWLQIQMSGFEYRCNQIFWEVVGLERGPPSLVCTIEELLERKSSGSGLENRKYGRRNPSLWPRGTLYPQKLALSSPTSGRRSVGIFRSRTQATEFVPFFKSLGVRH
jgi:hypothetical protein